MFLTIAPDDVHNPLSIRLQVETSSNNNFPASATDFLEVLKNEPERFKREHLRTDCEASALEDVLQRGAAQHPASTSLLFDRISQTVLEVLCGTPPTSYTGKTLPLSARAKGLFGIGLGSFAVVEQSGRGTHHLHVLAWCGAMSGLCSGAALHSTAFEALADALRDQFQCSLPIEVHVLDAARRAMFVPLCRSEYDKAPRVLSLIHI